MKDSASSPCLTAELHIYIVVTISGQWRLPATNSGLNLKTCTCRRLTWA